MSEPLEYVERSADKTFYAMEVVYRVQGVRFLRDLMDLVCLYNQLDNVTRERALWRASRYYHKVFKSAAMSAEAELEPGEVARDPNELTVGVHRRYKRYVVAAASVRLVLAVDVNEVVQHCEKILMFRFEGIFSKKPLEKLDQYEHIVLDYGAMYAGHAAPYDEIQELHAKLDLPDTQLKMLENFARSCVMECLILPLALYFTDREMAAAALTLARKHYNMMTPEWWKPHWPEIRSDRVELALHDMNIYCAELKIMEMRAQPNEAGGNSAFGRDGFGTGQPNSSEDVSDDVEMTDLTEEKETKETIAAEASDNNPNNLIAIASAEASAYTREEKQVDSNADYVPTPRMSALSLEQPKNEATIDISATNGQSVNQGESRNSTPSQSFTAQNSFRRNSYRSGFDESNSRAGFNQQYTGHTSRSQQTNSQVYGANQSPMQGPAWGQFQGPRYTVPPPPFPVMQANFNGPPPPLPFVQSASIGTASNTVRTIAAPRSAAMAPVMNYGPPMAINNHVPVPAGHPLMAPPQGLYSVPPPGWNRPPPVLPPAGLPPRLTSISASFVHQSGFQQSASNNMPRYPMVMNGSPMMVTGQMVPGQMIGPLGSQIRREVSREIGVNAPRQLPPQIMGPMWCPRAPIGRSVGQMTGPVEQIGGPRGQMLGKVGQIGSIRGQVEGTGGGLMLGTVGQMGGMRGQVGEPGGQMGGLGSQLGSSGSQVSQMRGISFQQQIGSPIVQLPLGARAGNTGNQNRRPISKRQLITINTNSKKQRD